MNDNNNYQKLKEYNEQKYVEFTSIINEFFKGTPVQEFSFQRFFLGGTHLSLFSHINYRSYYFSERDDLGHIFCEVIKKLKENQFYFFVWPLPNTADPFFENIYRFNIFGGLSIYKRFNNYVDVFHFSGEADTDMINFYVNNKTFFLEGVNYFLEKGKDFLSIEDKSIFGIHTGKYILDSFNEAPLAKKGFSFQISGKQTTITPQEFKCLSLIARGFTIKWVAKELKLSSRTIESHLNSVKIKCNLSCKDLLVDLFHKVIKKEHLEANDTPLLL